MARSVVIELLVAEAAARRHAESVGADPDAEPAAQAVEQMIKQRRVLSRRVDRPNVYDPLAGTRYRGGCEGCGDG